MAATATPPTLDAELEAQIEKYRPKSKAGEPASGGTLWHLNKHGLLGKALGLQSQRDNKDVTEVTITKLVAWEVMADAQRAGVVFRQS